MPYYYSNVGSTVELAEVESLSKGSLIVGDGDGAPREMFVGVNGTTLIADSSTATGLKWDTTGGSGETNTASNQNAGGVGVYKQKTGVDLEFRGINAASSGRVTVTLDSGNNEIDLDVNETKFSWKRTFALMGC